MLRKPIELLILVLLVVMANAADDQTELFITNKSESCAITELMKQENIPGVSITLIKDFSVAWTKTYGTKEQNKNDSITDNTLFQAASISKSLTAAVVLKEVQKRTWKLDDPVNTLLHTWKIPSDGETKTTSVLLRQLMDHSGGVTVSGFDGYTYRQEIPTTLEILTGEVSNFRTARGVRVNSAPIVIDTVPGKRFKYSGGGYVVLQQLLMDHFDVDFTALMKEQLLDVLNMKASTFAQPLEEIRVKDVAFGHQDSAKVVEGGHHTYPEQAAAGLWTTSEDLAKFVIDIQKSIKDGSGKLLDQESAELMSSAGIAPYAGLGLFLREPHSKERGYFQHEGWNMGYSSMFIAHKYKGYGVVVLTNANKPAFIKDVIASLAKENHWIGL